MRIFSYDRTSRWTEEKVSNEAQWQKVLNRALKEYEAEPQRFSDLGRSGGNGHREAFQALQATIAQSFEQGVLYVWRYDRIYRETQKALEFVELCHKHNIEIVSIAEPLPAGNTSLAAKKMFVQLLFINASMQRDSTIENHRSGLAHKKSKGKYLASAVPFGYRLVNGEVLQDEKEAATVKRLFELYNTGDYGYKKLTEALTKEGYLFRGHPFKSHNIWNILDKPIYYGLVKGGSFGSYLGDFIPIIDEAIFQKAQIIRETRTLKKVNRRDYSLRKKIVCPNCGWKLSPQMQWNYGKTKRLHYYHCANRECKGAHLNALMIEKQVINCLRKFLKRNEVYQGILTEISTQLQQIKKQEKLTFQEHQKKKTKILEDFEEGIISPKELKQLLNKVNENQKKSSDQVMNQTYQAQLDNLLLLRKQSIQRIMIDQVEKVILQKDQKIKGLYLKNISQNIYSE